MKHFLRLSLIEDLELAGIIQIACICIDVFQSCLALHSIVHLLRKKK